MVNDTPISATDEKIEDIKWTFRRARKPKKNMKEKKKERAHRPSLSRLSVCHLPMCATTCSRHTDCRPSEGSHLLVSTPDQKKIDFFVPSNITSHYTCYCSILKEIFILAEERSATFSRHSKLCNHPSYLKNRSSVFHTISILSSPLIITFLITFWIFSLSKDSILMIFSNCVSNLPAELSSVGSSDLSCSIF